MTQIVPYKLRLYALLHTITNRVCLSRRTIFEGYTGRAESGTCLEMFSLNLYGNEQTQKQQSASCKRDPDINLPHLGQRSISAFWLCMRLILKKSRCVI